MGGAGGCHCEVQHQHPFDELAGCRSGKVHTLEDSRRRVSENSSDATQFKAEPVGDVPLVAVWFLSDKAAGSGAPKHVKEALGA
jgi:hypothetical protein